jgi:hypothetical protein
MIGVKNFLLYNFKDKWIKLKQFIPKLNKYNITGSFAIEREWG